MFHVLINELNKIKIKIQPMGAACMEKLTGRLIIFREMYRMRQ